MTGYYWLEGDISDEVGIGLMTGSTLLTLLFLGIVVLPKIQCLEKNVQRNQIEMTPPSSSLESLQKQFEVPKGNPYRIN